MTQNSKQSTSQTEVSLKHRTVTSGKAQWAINIVENRRHDTWHRAARILRNGEPWGEIRQKHNGKRVTMSPYGKFIPLDVLKAAEKDLG